MNKKNVQTVSEIEEAKKSLRRGQAVLEIHVSNARKRRSVPYTNGDVTGTLTIKGHVFRHASGNALAMIAYVCGIRTVKVYSPHAEPDTKVLAAYHHPSANRPWAHRSDEGRFLLRFNVTLVRASTSKRQPKVDVDRLEGMLSEELANVPVAFRVNTSFERGEYNEQGYVMTPLDYRMREQAALMKSIFENLGRRSVEPVRVGNVTYLRAEYMCSH